MKNWIINLTIVVLVISIIIILAVIAANDLSSNESTLLGVLLTLLSVVASWIVSSYFSTNSQKTAIEEVKLESQNNLRTYALNAAEKVNNLSSELSKLALYLKTELEKDDSTDEYALNSKIERIESAIHIINTLKSVNDTSLSDWKGVIGDELEVREEEKEEREERLLQITENIENILQNQTSNKKKEISEEIIFIKRQLENLGNSIGNPSLTSRISSKPRRDKIDKPCPNCQVMMSYSQRENVKGHKTIKCSNCGKRSLSRFSPEAGFYLIAEQFIKESFNCPICNEVLEDSLSNIPYTKQIVSCENCGNKIKTTRNIDMGLTIAAITTAVQLEKPKSIPIDEKLLLKVQESLPNQPWPTAIHKTVAEQLTIPNSIAYKCISELIKQGKFNPQIDGIVFVKSEMKGDEMEQ